MAIPTLVRAQFAASVPIDVYRRDCLGLLARIKGKFFAAGKLLLIIIHNTYNTATTCNNHNTAGHAALL
jgi:N-acetylmuramoyl-L-alanine amidase CwlA